MSAPENQGARYSVWPPWKQGIRARLLLAFFGISAFAVLAAAAGIYAVREVGSRLESINERIPPTLSALELARSAERIIATAPAMLATLDPVRRDEVRATLAAEVELLNARLAELEDGGSELLSRFQFDPVVSALTANLASLDDRVASRLATNERIRTVRLGTFETNGQTQRLLAPWLEILGAEIGMLVKAREANPGASEQPSQQRLASLVEQQRQVRTAQAQVSSLAEMLAEASTADQPRRLEILAFQLGLAFRDLEETTGGLDPKLQPPLLEYVATLREFAEGPDSILEARRQELVLVGEGEKLLNETAELSAQLTAAVDQLGSAAKGQVDAAIIDTISVQRLSTRALVVFVVMSLAASLLIAWRYVGGNLLRRLTAISEAIRGIAAGKMHKPVIAEGTDEIAAMGQAVEILRQNSLERDELLAERAQAAAHLEREVAQRTAELAELVNRLRALGKYKSHFIASASHDLRQPLHALNLFVSQLRDESDAAKRDRLIGHINAAVGSMNELFEALLDMSKLEAGTLEPNFADFPVSRLFTRIETTFALQAHEKGLRFRIIPSTTWLRSDFVLLERILFNLVSNALRYTTAGGVVVGGRHRGALLRIDVCDTGVGIAEDQQQDVFAEFYQLAGSDQHGGLGLGLVIVERMSRVLGHAVELNSRPGRGSRFSVSVPLAAGPPTMAEDPAVPEFTDPARGKLVVVIENDPLVIHSMAGILRSWGCNVLHADSEASALTGIAVQSQQPEIVIADYHLGNGRTGIQAIEHLRFALGLPIPAFLISGDTAPERLRDANDKGLCLLHKPVSPIRLRAMVNQFLSTRDAPRAAR